MVSTSGIATVGREFFARPTITVARALIGRLLIVDMGTTNEIAARIVETEAYMGWDDPASHAFHGATRRSAIMFGPPGFLYVYLIYGIHHCANIVTERDGIAGAVLLRAATVEWGEEVVRKRRGQHIPAHRLLSGPGNFCRGLGITRRTNGLDVCNKRLLGISVTRNKTCVDSSPRIGISPLDRRPLRFYAQGHGAVSYHLKKGVRTDTTV